jgi:hypothetical protein
MRRRALLAASQTGGGGKKIVNTITLTWGTGGFLNYKELIAQALYPVNSSLIVVRGTSGNAIQLQEGEISDSGFFMSDETFEIGFGYDGPFAQEIEDDIYIYKLVIA